MKTLDIPTKLLRILAYAYNINPNHYGFSLLMSDLKRYKSGLKGERSLNYYLYPIIHKNYECFFNLRLNAYNQHFEIDALLITNQFILIIEVKNLIGSLHIDHDSGALIQVTADKEKLYQDPILQVERQKDLLNLWLKARGYNIPIETRVCFVNQYGILNRTGNMDSRIMYGYKLSHEFQKLQEKYQSHPYAIDKTSLLELFMNENTPLELSIMKKYKLGQTDFQPGIICLNCFKKTVIRNRNNYICSQCHHQNPDSFDRAMKDYFLIYGPKTTNKKTRLWIKESDRSFVKKNLNRIATMKSGNNRSMNYYLNFDYDSDFDYMTNYLRKV